MGFEFSRNTLPITEIYKKFNSGEYIVDQSYQRRKVWSEKDNIRLIETILLNLVIPEIFLWPAEIDPETGDTIVHIVDGQQRINAIVEFISGKYPLKRSALLTDEIKEHFGGCYFDDLAPEVKGDLWYYKLSIVNIDRSCTIDDIKNMFYRLNITDYRLNEQEIRNSLPNYFGKVALNLSRDDFWDEIKVFSSNDVKRMRDVEYCAGILILADEGIVDQTTSKKLNHTYDIYKEEYPPEQEVTDLIYKSSEIILELKNDSTEKFLSRKTQLYTAFSFVFYMIEKNVEFDEDIKNKFILFIKAYNGFKNDISETDIPENLRDIYQLINNYRLASSEGVNKLANRMLRFEILKRVCLPESEFNEGTLEELIETLNDLSKR